MFKSDLTVKELHALISAHPEYEMSLLYDYGCGKLRFWKRSRDSISALDGIGNRVSFKDNSAFTFNGRCFSVSEECAMSGGRRTMSIQ